MRRVFLAFLGLPWYYGGMKRTSLENRITTWWQTEKGLLLLCLGAVFFWGLAAHAYGFLRSSLSHDMLNAFVVSDVETYWKMQLGRPGIVLYRRIFRGLIAAPWQLGLLSLLWLGLSCYVTASLLRVPGKLFPVLLAGILTVNLSVTAGAATYLYELDADLFGMLLGVLAVLLWERGGRWGAAAGVLLTAACMGTYQSMVSVPVTLIMLLSMAALLRGEGFGPVFRKGLRAIAMLLLGALLYWLLVQLMCALKHINLTADSYNSLAGAEAPLSIADRFANVYRTWAAAFWNPSTNHIEPLVLWLNILLPLSGLIPLASWLFGKRAGTAEKLLFLALLLLLPLGMNTAQLAFSRDVHDLMEHAFWLFYLLCLLPLFLLEVRSLQKALAAVLALLLLYSGVQTANIVYTKKHLEEQACLSLMTRVMGRLETEESYVSGETPLVFVGVSPELNQKLPGFEAYNDIEGCWTANPLNKSTATYYFNTYAAYLRWVLNSPAVTADTGTWTALQTDPRVLAMPCYPADGCIRDLDGVFVIKLGETEP